jgi:energy-coupling factor transporter ATP-binding protein EcfA2
MQPLLDLSGVGLGICVPAFVNWRKRRRKREIPAGNTPLLVLAPQAENVLRQLMGMTEQNRDNPLADFNIVYQQRQTGRDIYQELNTAIKDRDRVIVLGRTGIGKTREVCQFAERLNAEGWQIIKLTDGADMWLDEPKCFPLEIDREQNTLFIIDDLNRWMRPSINPNADDPLQPYLEECCLRASANVSYENAAKDIEKYTGMSISASTQKRIVQRHEFPDIECGQELEEISVDGGKVRLRTETKGESCVWKDYKAIYINREIKLARLGENEVLIDWVNHQKLADPLTCLGDGYPGVWKIVREFNCPGQRREILD